MNPETNTNPIPVDDITPDMIDMNPTFEDPISEPDISPSPEADTPPADPPIEPGTPVTDGDPDGDTPGASTEPGADDGAGGGTPVTTADTTIPADPPDPDIEPTSEADDFLALSEETGVQVSTDDDIVNALIELNSLRQGGSPSNLSSAIKEAIEVEKSGGNLADHFARVGMDFTKMDGADVLRQQFFKTEAPLYNNNPKFAQMKFERSFKAKYGNWIEYDRLTDADDKADFAEEHGGIENIEYEKMMFQADTDMARAELSDWQKTAAAEVKSNATGMSPAQETEYAATYKAKAEKSWSGFSALSIGMGEGLQDFSLGLNDTTRPQVEGWINNPSLFLRDIGFDGEKIDTDRLLPIMTAIAELSNGTFGPRIAKYVVNNDNIETFKKTIEKPPTSSPSVTPDQGSDDPWSKIGDAAEKARLEAEGR